MILKMQSRIFYRLLLILFSNYHYLKETKRITELFEDLNNGEPWIDVMLTGTLQHITAEKTAKKVSSNRNSIC